MNRNAEINRFLQSSGWSDAERIALAGDASARRYMRLRKGAHTKILMDAPIDTCGDMTPFITIAHHLQAQKLRPPQIDAHDTSVGLILMEDFGDAIMASHIDRVPTQEETLYEHAVDVLIHLKHASLPDQMHPKNVDELTSMIEPVFNFYAPQVGANAKNLAFQSLNNAMSELQQVPHCLSLRDYHAENLIWLPQSNGLQKLGLLDFQDAFVTCCVYDLASLLMDARRDVSKSIAAKMITRFAKGIGQDESRVARSYHLIGLQRNLRILGIFKRLAMERGKPQYLALLPRVWAHVVSCLEALSDPSLVKAFSVLPPPEDFNA